MTSVIGEYVYKNLVFVVLFVVASKMSQELLQVHILYLVLSFQFKNFDVVSKLLAITGCVFLHSKDILIYKKHLLN